MILLFAVDRYNIKITKGDTMILTVHFNDVVIPEGTVALFTVKTYPNSPLPLIERQYLIDENNEIKIILSGNETELVPAEYSWDIRILMKHGENTEVITPFAPAKFEILKVVGNV